MTEKTYTYKTNDTVQLFHKICNLVYFGCGTNFMFDSLKLPTKFTKSFNYVSKVFEMLCIVLICSEWGAFFTQKNLTLVQKTDLFLFGPTSITLYVMYWNGVYRKGQIKELCFTLAVTLKEMFSNSEIEKQMIKKTWRFVVAMVCILFGFLLATSINNGYRALTTKITAVYYVHKSRDPYNNATTDVKAVEMKRSEKCPVAYRRSFKMLIKIASEPSAVKPPAYRNNDTLDLLRSICKVIYLSCATNFWFEDLKYHKIFMKIYGTVSNILEIIVVVFVISQWGPFYTQTHLNEKQTNDMHLFAFSHVIIYMVYASALYYKQELRKLVFTLGVRLKGVYNDAAVEGIMVKTAGRYLTGLVFVSSSTLISYGFGSGVQSLTTNATFTTVIPIWPDVEDRRFIAGIARILYYIIWCIFIVRTISIYLIILTITICLAHQFTNLCKYFESLNSIFEGTGADKERRYEDAFKVGIKMHSITLWCAKQTQATGSMAFSGEIVINVSVLVLIMMQMMYTERTLITLMPIFFLAMGVLVGSGVFMWNAGDVTIEASRLPTSMFYSGWHNCQGESSVRVRKMVTISISQAQIVKSSYSLFSVIY